MKVEEAKVEEVKKLISELTDTDILKVYSGKPGCACGCRGIYKVNPNHRAEADRDRGYPYTDQDISLATVRLILGKIQTAATTLPFNGAVQSILGDKDLVYIYAQVSSTRVYALYLTQEARNRLAVTAA